MGRSTIFSAMVLALSASSAAAAADGAASAGLSARPSPDSNWAGRPSFVDDGWACPPGSVWRNAGRTDWLCVDPAEARRVAEENRSTSRVGGSNCPLPLVSRDAFKNDPVCVEPARHDAVHRMNLALYNVH